MGPYEILVNVSFINITALDQWHNIKGIEWEKAYVCKQILESKYF